jgi:hypothetical protein
MVDVSENGSIKVKTYKDFVCVLIDQGQKKHFGDSAGLKGDFPQHPDVCTMPTPVQADHLRRHLSSSVDEAAAEMACAHWGEATMICIFDVLTTVNSEKWPWWVPTKSRSVARRGVQRVVSSPWTFAGGLFMFYIVIDDSLGRYIISYGTLLYASIPFILLSGVD